MIKSQEYLNDKYSLEIRKEVKELDISGWVENPWVEKPNWEKLTGKLDLSDFSNLEKLDCSFNKITSLNLTNCPNLTELKCWDNEIMEIKFPKSLKLQILQAWTNYLTELDWKAFNPKNLTQISISNNNLQEQGLSIFNRFTNLEELYLGTDIVSRLEERKYNRFHGSLKTLVESCKKIKKLQVEGTGVEEDLKHLPKDLEIISWHKQNEMIARIIPLERLYVIRNSIQQFLKKWSKQENYHWHELNYWKKQAKKESTLSRLKNPDDFSKSWLTVTGIQWINRANLVAGGSLVLIGQSNTSDPNSQIYTQIGGVVAIVGPFVETITSYVNDKIYDARQKKWDEFLTDAGIFLDNYHELMGILNQFENSSKLKGKVNKTIKELNEKIKEFLKVYDQDDNEEVDIEELIDRRNELIKDLEGNEDNKVKEIIEALKKLEEAIIEYRKFAYYEKSIKKEEVTENQATLQNPLPPTLDASLAISETPHEAVIEVVPALPHSSNIR